MLTIKDYLKPKNWYYFVQGNLLNFVIKVFLNNLTHIIEQVKYRKILVEKKSPKCLNGACTVCGCKTPELFYASKACEGGCYPELVSKDNWAKEKNKLSILEPEILKSINN